MLDAAGHQAEGRRSAIDLLESLDRASSLKDREHTDLGPSRMNCSGSTPPTDARRESPQRPAPDDASAAPAPAGAGPWRSSTRARTKACLEASSHTTIQDSRTIFDPGCFRCRYLATAEEQAQLGCLLQFINHLARNSARTNLDPRSHDSRSTTDGLIFVTAKWSPVKFAER